uniref:Uncharacterized protein n=1 Tax=Panagrolaimus superbus TaxID=310955 RepID=A0A914ZAA0_9BILA
MFCSFPHSGSARVFNFCHFKPAKSILRKPSVTESNACHPSTSESASTYRSLSDSDAEMVPEYTVDTRFLLKNEREEKIADFTGIYAPSTQMSDEQRNVSG